MRHKSVLIQEVLRCLNLKPGDTVVDGTLGSAGHGLEIAKQIGPKGRLIGLDQDPQSIARCRMILRDYPQASLHRENFLHTDRLLDSLNISSVDAVLLDVGFSSDQMEDPARGFSFERPGPLDMRMNPDASLSARDLVNDLSEKDLARLFFDYGEERQAQRFAQAICRERAVRPIETTQELVEVILRALNLKSSAKSGTRPPWMRRHPATRVFQALRIAVNGELKVLSESLPRIWKKIKRGGRFAVISFHSLEDRIVKRQFLAWHQNIEGTLVTKKPVQADRPEVLENPRARSAKLRAVEKI